MVNTPIPMVDLKAQLAQIRDEIHPALEAVMENTAFILGPSVKQFEANFASSVGSKHCVAVNSGTSALHLALLVAGVGPGDNVITVPFTFIATLEAIWMVGATPVLVDICEDTMTMDMSQVEAALTPQTKAVIPVHLYGQMAEMEPLMKLSEAKGFAIIEDACQAHLATQHGRVSGSFGHAGCFSFYPGKNLGAYGEGGAVVTDNESWAKRMRDLRDHGQSTKYYHDEMGFNYRMDGFQGAVLDIKLRHLPEWSRLRRERAAWYDEKLKDLPLTLPATGEGNEHVYHLYVIRHKDRDAIMEKLKQDNIASGLHYPIPAHLQKACEAYGWKEGDYPVSEQAAKGVLSIPIYPELSEAWAERVSVSLHNYFQEVHES